MNNELSNRIKINRNKLGMKQQDLADKVGVSLMTVLRWEKGVRTPNASMLPKLAEALNTSVEYLMGLTDDAPPETPQISLPINNMEKENKTPEYLDLGYWGNIVENAKRAARLGTEQEKAAALMMLRMATDAITGAEGRLAGGASIFQKADGVHCNVKQSAIL